MSDSDYPSKINAMLKNGQDPKDFMIEVCRPGCKQYEEKLRRCEHALKTMVHLDPEMTCMYPLRDWVTCVDGCVIKIGYGVGSAQDPHEACRQPEGLHQLIDLYDNRSDRITNQHVGAVCRENIGVRQRHPSFENSGEGGKPRPKPTDSACHPSGSVEWTNEVHSNNRHSLVIGVARCWCFVASHNPSYSVAAALPDCPPHNLQRFLLQRPYWVLQRCDQYAMSSQMGASLIARACPTNLFLKVLLTIRAFSQDSALAKQQNLLTVRLIAFISLRPTRSRRISSPVSFGSRAMLPADTDFFDDARQKG